MTQQALVRRGGPDGALDAVAVVERLITTGDLSKLNPQERVSYYNELCHSLGLNPLTRPFEYLTLSGKLVLYARKDATEQLRKINGVSIVRLEKEQDGDLYVVTAYARTADGREDSDMGAASTKGLAGDALVNARLKAVTKAKRRVTLSICGLGFLDESEVEAIPDARRPAAHVRGELPAPPEGGECDRLVSQIRSVLAELNARGYRPAWTKVTLKTYVNDKFMVADGLDAISNRPEELRDLFADLSSKLDALITEQESPSGGAAEEEGDETVF